MWCAHYKERGKAGAAESAQAGGYAVAHLHRLEVIQALTREDEVALVPLLHELTGARRPRYDQWRRRFQSARPRRQDYPAL